MGTVKGRLVTSQGVTAKMSSRGVISARMLSNRIMMQEKTVVPKTKEQIIIPDEGYDGLSRVTVKAIPDNYGEIVWDGSIMIVR